MLIKHSRIQRIFPLKTVILRVNPSMRMWNIRVKINPEKLVFTLFIQAGRPRAVQRIRATGWPCWDKLYKILMYPAQPKKSDTMGGFLLYPLLRQCQVWHFRQGPRHPARLLEFPVSSAACSEWQNPLQRAKADPRLCPEPISEGPREHFGFTWSELEFLPSFISPGNIPPCTGVGWGEEVAFVSARLSGMTW